MSPPNMSDEEDDEEELLMAAAGQWAASAADDSGEDDSSAKKKSKKSKKSKKEKKEKKPKRDKPKEGSDASTAKIEQAPVNTEQNTTRQVFSLHLTKVPYEATQTDIRCAFSEKGCYVTSVRLVYDRKANGERNFRGVAFVDLGDEASFQKGLALHGTKFLGNKYNVNVRPTKSKGELTEIVRKTQEKVAMLIARSKEKEREERASNPEAYEAKKEAKKDKKDKKKRKRGGNSEPNDGDTPHTKKSKIERKGHSPKQKSNNTVVSNKESNKSTPKKEGEPKKKHSKSKSKKADVKLTKKQRAKKAAVINLLKRKKMK
eukprot:scaffold11577_cov86-Skeletonema_dohrnii-CCMP3373.AAC.3